MICRSLMRCKLLCLAAIGLQQRVYALYMNKGFIFFHPWMTRAGIVMYLFHTASTLVEPCLSYAGGSHNKAWMNIESQHVSINSSLARGLYMKAALTFCLASGHYMLSSGQAYSHQVLFTLSYLLVSINPIFDSSSLCETKGLSMQHRFRNELAFLIC
jgi:hypothetical protein